MLGNAHGCSPPPTPTLSRPWLFVFGFTSTESHAVRFRPSSLSAEACARRFCSLLPRRVTPPAGLCGTPYFFPHCGHSAPSRVLAQLGCVFSLACFSFSFSVLRIWICLFHIVPLVMYVRMRVRALYFGRFPLTAWCVGGGRLMPRAQRYVKTRKREEPVRGRVLLVGDGSVTDFCDGECWSSRTSPILRPLSFPYLLLSLALAEVRHVNRAHVARRHSRASSPPSFACFT